MRKRKQSLGAIEDDPFALISTAVETLETAKEPLDYRIAAETVHLALASAVERATAKPARSTADIKQRVEMIAKKTRNDLLVDEFKRLRDVLHSQCFYQAKCLTPTALAVEFGQARGTVKAILQYKRPKTKR